MIYKKPHLIAFLVQLSLIAMIVISGWKLLGLYGFFQEASQLSPQVNVSETDLSSKDPSNSKILLGLIAIFVISALLFLRWTFVVACNAVAFRTQPMKFTPGTAVTGHLLPVVNLIMPYLAMKEIWIASFLHRHANTGKAPSSIIPVIWWCSWALTLLFVVVYYFVEKKTGHSVLVLMEKLKVEMILTCLQIGTAAMAILLVLRLTSYQKDI